MLLSIIDMTPRFAMVAALLNTTVLNHHLCNGTLEGFNPFTPPDESLLVRWARS